MDNIKLIYFSDCQNYAAAKDLLLKSGYAFAEINQDNLPESHPLKLYTSPAILKNGKLIVGEKTDSKGCSIQLPDAVELKRKLQA